MKIKTLFLLLLVSSLSISASRSQTNLEVEVDNTSPTPSKTPHDLTYYENLVIAVKKNSRLEVENEQLKAQISLLKLQQETLSTQFSEIKEQLDNKPSKDSFELLSKSVFERLRTTDDSISIWGDAISLLGILITLVLAFFALFHLGKLRNMEKQATSRLQESQKEVRMAVNQAVTTSRNAAKTITNNWIEEHGAIEIKEQVNTLKNNLNSVSNSLSKMRENERQAINTTRNIKEYEELLSRGSTATTKSNKAPPLSKLISNPLESIPVLADYLSRRDYKKCLAIANQIQSRFSTEKPNIQISVIKLIAYERLGRHPLALHVYQNEIYTHTQSSEYKDDSFSYGHTVSVLSDIYLGMGDYTKVHSMTSELLDYVAEKGTYLNTAGPVLTNHVLSSIELNTSEEITRKKIESISDIYTNNEIISEQQKRYAL
ncbi:hypothetical protein JV59_33705 [Vibrio coralliilyticus]|uniref:hypothetical protein n=1 Tax=Vibrio coralliilyticus TaxID=190893 RepID=UPI00051281FB|nr:hypothetical protein [Vibrio coralliilyticus]AIU67248.1 hypothetical protein JV59_33705 [Vibrio coralliilyticus]